MNFKTLVNNALQESGESGSGIQSVETARGIEARFCSWVRRAWLFIQEERQDFNFMRKQFEFDLSPGKHVYPLTELMLTDVDRWEFKNATVYPTAEPGRIYRLNSDLNYDHYLNSLSLAPGEFRVGPVRNVMVVDGTFNDLLLWPVPDQQYRVRLDYFRAPVSLLKDSDFPALQPENLQWAIIWKALLWYAYYDGAPEIGEEASIEFERLEGIIDSRYKPQMSINHAASSIGSRR